MERTLTDKLKDIEQGYQAARFREELLKTYAIPNRTAFRRILADGYPPEEHRFLTQQAFVDGPAFVQEWNRQCTLEEWKGYKEEEVLHTESAILWAVDMVEKNLLPSNPRLAEHVLWVKTFLTT